METAAVVIPLIDGRRIVLSGGVLTIRDRTGAVVIRVEMHDVTGINRGGSDLVITRRQTDPIAVTAATLADAQRFIELLSQHTSTPASKRWWRRYPSSRSTE